jgi:hypothetical protein
MTQRLDVAALRFQTELTGVVNAVQVKSISAWPSLGIKGLKSHETQINPESREVTYLLKFKPKKDIKDLRVLRIIEESVWALVGDTWRTTFIVGKRILYAGARRKEIHDTGISFGKGRAGFDPSRA